MIRATASGFEGSGVMSVAVEVSGTGGDAYAETNGETKVDNGMFGVAAIALGGNATVSINGDVDPPLAHSQLRDRGDVVHL